MEVGWSRSMEAGDGAGVSLGEPPWCFKETQGRAS